MQGGESSACDLKWVQSSNPTTYEKQNKNKDRGEPKELDSKTTTTKVAEKPEMQVFQSLGKNFPYSSPYLLIPSFHLKNDVSIKGPSAPLEQKKCNPTPSHLPPHSTPGCTTLMWGSHLLPRVTWPSSPRHSVGAGTVVAAACCGEADLCHDTNKSQIRYGSTAEGGGGVEHLTSGDLGAVGEVLGEVFGDFDADFRSDGFEV